MQQPSRIFLIGPMGAGKTAIGRQLARLLDMPFADLDAAIQDRTGVDISLIFDLEGEAGFRRREAELLDELTQRCPLVLATGGGAILAEANRRHLADRGHVVYLETSVATQLRRTSHSRHRPLLETTDRETRLQSLFAERAPIYNALADRVIRTDGRRTAAVARELARILQGSGE